MNQTTAADASVHVTNIDVFFQSQRADVHGDLVHQLVDFIAATRETLDLTGSCNFSENAESNDESALRIESPNVVQAYSARPGGAGRPAG